MKNYLGLHTHYENEIYNYFLVIAKHCIKRLEVWILYIDMSK